MVDIPTMDKSEGSDQSGQASDHKEHTIKCVVSDCSWSYPCRFGFEESMQIIKMHLEHDHRPPESQTDKNRYSKPDAPTLEKRKAKAQKACPSAPVPDSSLPKRQEKPPSNHPPNESPKVPCPFCFKLFRRYNGRNSSPFDTCINCFRLSKPGRKHRRKLTASEEIEAALLQPDDGECNCIQQNRSIVSCYTLNELNRTGRAHPKIALCINPAGSDKSMNILGVADTGAQADLMGLQDFLKAGFNKDILKNIPLKVRAANHQVIDIAGGFVANLEGNGPNDVKVKCQSLVLVSNSISGLYVSFDTLIKLKVISSNFPSIGAANPIETCSSSTLPASEELNSKKDDDTNQGCSVKMVDNQGCSEKPVDDSPCKCPQRSAVPLRPKTLPYEPIPENNEKMKKWLLSYFGSSTFNTCPHRPLQEMAGPPIEIHVSEDATPRVCNTPAHIPLHWQDKVYEDIKRDEALGILERVPYGEPVTWCHRLVVTRKHDGSPRRTVDLSPLNKFCKRETHGAESPFHLARRIPNNTWKTVSDAWNGYHSVPLREADRHLTTFITPFGRWRYTRAPQGYLSSGDGYNRRFAAILEDFPRKERCVDDTLHYDDDLEEHYWRTIDFLIRVGQSGIVLNPDKFQFASKEVDFAGFRIADDTVEPLPKHLEAIQSFPKPQSTTDIKSWFGLVNQVSQYAQLRDIMAPFRKFLSPRTRFEWNATLDETFERSKSLITESIRHGVQIFDIKRPTCLRPDWSRQGIGFFLFQKHCECESHLPNCCSHGWKITLAGSRFLSDTEARYAAVEGEALAIAWGLEQTKYFTQGCDNLLVVTDHKPLVGVFGDRTLDAITNTRLFRLKQRTLQWKFEIAYLPGRTNSAADAASRYPCISIATSTMESGDIEEKLMVSAIHHEASEVTSINWGIIADETWNDPVLSQLKKAIDEGFSGEYKGIHEFLKYKTSLFVLKGAVIYKDRVVIPTTLRPTVLDSLHAAHQGVTTMQLRAQTIVFWPGMTKDIAARRERCTECNRNAPSQAVLPTVNAESPSTPFEQIVADFFEFGGRRYLVAADRLSGYSEIFFTPTGTINSGARGLISCLRKWFQTFGVPDQLSSDGGTEFTADSTRKFLTTWGVSHRVSAAYNAPSNGRAEVAVKTAKRLMRSNINASGNLDTDKFLQAMLQLRNTPDPDCGISPAEIVFGRKLRDNLKFASYLERGSYAPRWQQAWASKEDALRKRFARTAEKLNTHARYLPPLAVGESCFIQNQRGNLKRKWHQTGVVVEVLPYDRYVLRVDGSGRLTTRNRRFLRKYTPYSTTIPNFEEAYDCDAWQKQRTPLTDNTTPVPDMANSGLPPSSSQECEPAINIPGDPGDDEVDGESPRQIEESVLPGTQRAPPNQEKMPLCLRRLQPFLHDAHEEMPPRSRLRPRPATSS